MQIKQDLPAAHISEYSKAIELIKKGIWAYFLLLIFEGALRKWILPGLSTPLLLIREPITIYIIYKAVSYRVIKGSLLLNIFVFTGIISIFTAIFLGHQNMIVALFGARIFLLHIPLIYVFKEVITNDDIVKIGKATLWISIIMCVVIFLQFYSPQDAWINRGVGGDESGAGFSGAMGYMRPPGLFSFTNGVTAFYSFASPFIFFFLSNGNIKVNKILLIAATISLLVAIPLSISRTLLFNVILTLLFTIFLTARNPKFLSKIIGGIILLVLIYFIASQQHSVQVATEVFTARFDSANKSEGGLVEGVLVDRFLGGMYNSLFSSTDVPFWGYGIGMGSNVGAILLSGSRSFLLPEGEWGRLIGEIGVLLGLLIVLIRIGLGIFLFTKSFTLVRYKNTFPWTFISTGLIYVMQGQWGQPTNLGFFVVFTGILMAATSDKNRYFIIEQD